MGETARKFISRHLPLFSGRGTDVAVEIRGPGVARVRSRDVVTSEQGRRQVDAFRQLERSKGADK